MRTKSFLQIDNREPSIKNIIVTYRAGEPHTYLVKNVYYPFFIILKRSVFDMDKIQTVQQIKYYSFDCVVIVYGGSPRWFKTHIIQFNILELSISNIFRGRSPRMFTS